MRFVLLAFAALFFVLAVAGAFLPVLPTTPFLLLTSWCLVRASPRLNAKLRRSPLFGPLLRDWEAYHGVRLHVKITALTVLVLAVTGSLVFGSLTPWLQVVLLALATLGAYVIVRLRTVRDAESTPDVERDPRG